MVTVWGGFIPPQVRRIAVKLNNRRTILVGLAFLSICTFWQMYDSVMTLILTDTFKLNETFAGAIMAADNVLALFLLPFFGALSDKTHTKIGHRMPFIVGGTAAAAVLMNLIPLLDDRYAANPSPATLVIFIVVLGLLLVAMGTYRSPAVALMPDVTPKPLRSRANAIINLMGAVGGILYLLITTFLYHVKSETYVSFFPLFAIVAGIMAAALAVVMFFVNEPELVKKQQGYERKHPEDDLTEHTAQGDTLPADVKKSLTFLLVSISLWFVGYNGVSTWFSVYAENIWGMSLGQANTCLTIATGGAILSYIPIGTVASRIGRRKTIRFGTLLLSGSFLAAFLLTMALEGFSPVLYVLFLLVGLAWASINVNSLPMVVEMCKGSEVGKFTGLYYTFSMSAQIITPIVAGWLLRNVSYRALFPYAAVFVFASFLTMGFVRHGDNKVPAKKGLEAYDVED